MATNQYFDIELAEGDVEAGFRKGHWRWPLREDDGGAFATVWMRDRDGNRCSCCRLFERDLSYGPGIVSRARLRMIGIGGVFTPERERGQGAALIMLETVMRYIRENRQLHCGAVLFASLDPSLKLYRRAGFSLIKDTTEPESKGSWGLWVNMTVPIVPTFSDLWTLEPRGYF